MPAAFDRSYFDPTYLDLFWQMLTERMHVYWRRLEGAPPPWTTDPILRDEFITNVYRELDPGTTFLMQRILQNEELSEPDKVFNVMLYRLMGSRVEFHEHLHIPRIEDYDPVEFAEQCKKVERAIGLSPFGEAYRTAAYTDYGSTEKIVNVSMLFKDVAQRVESMMQEFRNCLTLEACYRVIESVPGFGEFLAYQVMVDLLYPAPFEPILPYDQNTWVMAGPGARRGIWRMLKKGMKPNSLLEVMVWLRDHQEEEFERLGLEFPYLADESQEDDPPLLISLCNIQASLCEYFKYTRIWDGDQKYVRKYNYNQRLTEQFDIPSVITVEHPSKSEGIGGVSVGALGPDGTSDASHEALVGSSPAGEDLLGVSGSEHGNGVAPLLPQVVTYNSGQVVNPQVYEFTTSGTALNHNNVRVGAPEELVEVRANLLDALLQSHFRLRADRQVIKHILAVIDASAASAQGQVESGDKQVTLHFHL